jgi:hypothetical protein
MYLMRLEPTIPVFEQAKTFRALERAATVIGFIFPLGQQFSLKL